jgi:SAM-dependent methyltransferase
VVGALPLTGERTVPGIAEENYWFRRHEAAYAWLLPFVVDRIVLEVGCGEGYGTAMIADVAKSVVGIDYDLAAVTHAAGRYPSAEFVRANLARLPIEDHSVDVVATLQVIEHVWDHPQFVRECARVLRPGGLLVVSTPNRLTFSPGLDVPVNPFHTKEFTAAELSELIDRCGFELLRMLGLHAGQRLHGLDARYGGSFVDAQLAQPPGEWSAELAADVVSVAIGDFEILDEAGAAIDASLDLIAVARTPG